MKVGIYGGSFNPPHTGHLIVAESVREQIPLDRILFIPSANPPNKSNPSLASASDRFQMTQLAVEGNPDFEVTDIETRRGGISYTIDTVKSLAETRPHDQFSLIIGADNFLEFQTWKSPHDILQYVDLIVMTRPGYPMNDQRNEFLRLARLTNVPQIGISGTDIRRRVKSGRSIRYLVPRLVEDFVSRHRLYTT